MTLTTDYHQRGVEEREEEECNLIILEIAVDNEGPIPGGGRRKLRVRGVVKGPKQVGS